MKRFFLALLVLALILPSLALAQTTIDPTAKRGIKPERGLPNNPAIAGESMTTGLPTDAPYVPVLVNIDNVSGAWPQWGIKDADIIYEMPIHGLGLTRLMGLFAYTHPEEVGPTRSGRVMHAEMRQEWDAAWVFVGVQSKEGSDVNQALYQLGAKKKDVNLLINGATGKSLKYFKSIKGYARPHNHSVNLAQVKGDVQAYDFPQRAFLFTDELPVAGVAATQISLRYGSEGNAYTNSNYTYDAATNLYSRYRQNKPYEDRDQPGVPLTFSNVIVQWTALKFNGAANAPLLTEVGEGNADIFTGGRYIPGYWVRESVDSRTVFYDADGKEIKLQRGKTFINITTDRSTKLSYE
ncbi:MAG: DUF3048 domain-containing protein [Clostridiales bacterium]|nr:DUF3048 domain-containing protein [Clostridiales bacterium]